ncbi:MAG: hypothetical protein JST28_00980 [Acidobacteria bacterium]|nr:hypothetical protein [Acidobacteriota bacterium]
MSIVEPRTTEGNFAVDLSKLVLCAFLLCCSACNHRRIAIEKGFRLEENGGAPMLVPTDSQPSDTGNFQTTKLVLSGGLVGAPKHQLDPHCLISGDIFSLRSGSPQDPRQWIVRSPSISGWNLLSGQVNIDSQWKTFVRGIERMNEKGCFPSGLTSLKIRAAVAQRIPLPSNEVPLFFYSDKRTGFTDLAPEMEVRLHGFLPAAKPVSAQVLDPPRMWVASYEVIPRHGKGVRLKLAHRIQRGPNADSEPEDRDLLSLAQRFAQAPVLRLFLEGVYGAGQVSHGILIGASSQDQLEALTEIIHRSDPVKCKNYQGTVCAEFPLGALSLFSAVRVNGHRTSCLFGASLADFLGSLPPSEQKRAPESVHVFRRVNSGHYAEVDFSHVRDGAAQLVLLPGDRVEWTH